jgi:hypothetical protein
MVGRWWIGMGLVVAGIGALAPAGRTEESAGAAPRAGMQAHIDPATGRLVPEPVVAPPAQALPARRPPLVAVQAPGGGTMLELDDRYRSTTTATIEPDGSVRLDCTTGSTPHAPDDH